MHRNFALVVLALSLVSACIGPGPASTARLDPSAPNPASVDACVARARTFRDLCEASNGATDERVRLWDGYMALCSTGDTDLLLASLDCLDDRQCRTFSDANEGNACLDAVHAGMQPAPITTWLESFCARCGNPDCPIGRAEIIPYLPAAEAPSLDACAASATCSIDGVVAACAGEIAQLAPFATP